MSISVHRDQGVIRAYRKGKSFKGQAPYKCSMSFLELSPKDISIGSLGGEDLEEIRTYLKESGFCNVFGYFPTKFRPRGFSPMEGSLLKRFEL